MRETVIALYAVRATAMLLGAYHSLHRARKPHLWQRLLVSKRLVTTRMTRDKCQRMRSDSAIGGHVH
jgi:hypothetical protein